MDQQPQYQSAPPQQSPGSQWGPTSIGLESHIAAGLGYLIPIIGLIFFFIEKTNRFVRFHAAQSVILGVVAIALFIVEIIVNTIFSVGASAVNSSGAALGALGLTAIVGCVFFIMFLGLFGLWIWGMISGFMGKATKLPVIGGIAESLAGGPLA